jgi:hypothetical protein
MLKYLLVTTLVTTYFYCRKGTGDRADRSCQPCEHRRSSHTSAYRSLFQTVCKSTVCRTKKRSADTEEGQISMSCCLGMERINRECM